MRRGICSIYRNGYCHFSAIFLRHFARVRARETLFPRFQWQQPFRGTDMNRQTTTAFAAELAAQVVLAAAVGLFVSIALAAAALLLAA
jgi:hypothetical protein